MNSSELIHRYFLGIATVDEVHALESRLRNEDGFQDEFLFQDELDSHLRQQAQSVSTADEQPQLAQRKPSRNIWRWVSGISTLAATILLALLLLNFPPQKSALAYPSLGDLKLNLSFTETNIWAAAGGGDLATVRLELQKSVPVDSRLDCGLTPLHIATLFNRKAAVELLISEGADVSLADAEGNTPLHMAAFLGHTDLVRILLAANADPGIRNNLGFSATDIVAVTWSSGLEAYYRNAEKVLETTLDLKQIRIERPKILKLLSAASGAGADGIPTISIWQAAMTGNTAAIEQHIAAGSDLNAKEDFGGSTPLILSAIFGHLDVAKLLVDAGADLEVRNTSGGTALHLACFFCQPEVVELLLHVGADPDKTNNDELTPLGIVTIEFNSKLEGGYRYVYESLGLEFDLDHIKKTRPYIAEMLLAHARDKSAKAENSTEEQAK